MLTNHGAAPVLVAVEYGSRQEHATDHGEYSVYSGPPSTEQEKAWDRLVKRRLRVQLRWPVMLKP